MALAILSNVFIMRSAVRDHSGVVLAVRDQMLAVASDPLIFKYATEASVVNAQYSPDVTVGSIRMLVARGELVPAAPSAQVMSDMRRQLIIEPVPDIANGWTSILPTLHAMSGVTQSHLVDSKCSLLSTAALQGGRFVVDSGPNLAFAIRVLEGPAPTMEFAASGERTFIGQSPLWPAGISTRGPGLLTVATQPGRVAICAGERDQQ